MTSNRSHNPLLTRPVRSGVTCGENARPYLQPRTPATSEPPRQSASCKASAHAATPTVRPPARSRWLRAAPWPPRALKRPSARPEPAAAFRSFFPPSPPGSRPLTCRLPRRSRTPLHPRAKPTAQTAPSPSETREQLAREVREEAGPRGSRGGRPHHEGRGWGSAPRTVFPVGPRDT